MGKAATKLGGDTFSFFTRNPRGGAAKAIVPEDARALVDYMREKGFGRLVAHGSYTMNVCAAKPETKAFSVQMMIEDMERMEYVPGNYYNFHPGSHVGQGAEVAIPMIAEAINTALKPEHTTTILLETMAGKGTEVGRSFEELQAIIERVELKEKIGVCIDTCHTSDSGYDIIHHFDDVMEQFDRILGKEQIAVFHINDSKNVPGAAKDRHANIGFGEIGFDALNYIVHQSIALC